MLCIFIYFKANFAWKECQGKKLIFHFKFDDLNFILSLRISYIISINKFQGKSAAEKQKGMKETGF